MSYCEEDYLMLSGIQHFAFCRRQWALIHIEQQWADNYRTTSGELFHKKAHDETSFEKRGPLLTVRGLRISSTRLGVTGQCDIVEFHQDKSGIKIQGYDEMWSVVPVEYKRGKPKEGNEDEVQLCAQAMCLEEMFLTEIPNGYFFYGEDKRRREVLFTSDLRDTVEKICDEMHQLFQKGYTPKVKTSSKCKSCSLNALCIPQLMKKISVAEYMNGNLMGE